MTRTFVSPCETTRKLIEESKSLFQCKEKYIERNFEMLSQMCDDMWQDHMSQIVKLTKREANGENHDSSKSKREAIVLATTILSIFDKLLGLLHKVIEQKVRFNDFFML